MESPRLENSQKLMTQNDTMQDIVTWNFDGHVPQLKELCRRLWPGAQHDKTVIRHLGSSMNRVFEVGITDPSSGRSKEFILRYPCKRNPAMNYSESFSSILTRQVAMLRWLEQNTLLETARVLCYDATENNPIRTPYMIQDRLPGKSLQEVLTATPEELSIEKRLDLALALGRFFRNMRSITSSRAGKVVAAGTRPEPKGCDPFIAIQPFGAWSDPADEGDMGLMNFPRSSRLSCDIALAQSEPAWLKTKDVLVNAFSRRIFQYEARDGPERCVDFTGPLETGRGIMQRLINAGLFEDADDDEFSLCHAGLSPRHIMVDLSKTGNDILTGIVDWDDAIFAPGFVSCVPPVWLWAPSTLAHVPRCDDIAGPRETIEHNLTGPETPDLTRVKAAFDKEAGDFFVGRAYSRRYIYARALLYWVQCENSYEAKQSDELLKECQTWLYSDKFANDSRPDVADEGGSGAGDASDAASETGSDQTSEDEGKLTITIVETAEPGEQSDYKRRRVAEAITQVTGDSRDATRCQWSPGSLMAENQMLRKRIEELERMVVTAGRQTTKDEPARRDGITAQQPQVTVHMQVPRPVFLRPESTLLTSSPQALLRADFDIERAAPRVPRDNFLRHFIRTFLRCYP
ncbi:hypothetical protein VMCG_06830 [Cytospora schulzeri]|uniref:Aminoglycoside phosphotransferase domain-containing protein n=1 Tax=Cytospora schulzeri TaxID=448051 RepID=A0A423W208_9PEZI|nr:hypothetical protein VMCG_06830 [Valsa malicola]